MPAATIAISTPVVTAAIATPAAVNVVPTTVASTQVANTTPATASATTQTTNTVAVNTASETGVQTIANKTRLGQNTDGAAQVALEPDAEGMTAEVADTAQTEPASAAKSPATTATQTADNTTGNASMNITAPAPRPVAVNVVPQDTASDILALNNNVALLQSQFTGLDKRLGGLEAAIRDNNSAANAGTAAAMAMATMPQANAPGKSMVSFGVGAYEGEGAAAFGLSHALENGSVIIRASGTYSSKATGAAAGIGFQF